MTDTAVSPSLPLLRPRKQKVPWWKEPTTLLPQWNTPNFDTNVGAAPLYLVLQTTRTGTVQQ